MRLVVFALLATFTGTALAQETGEQSANTQEQSQFIGRYDGGGFETAMGMVVREDGTFQWGLSVGALDLRAQGTWFEEEGTIIFASVPKPMPPEFRWMGTVKAEGAPLLKVQLPGGKAFEYVDIHVQCSASQMSYYEIPQGGLVVPEEECSEPASITLELPASIVPPQSFGLAQQGWSKGDTIVFEFHRNDLGIADFDGVMGRLSDGVLELQGGLGAMILRKLSPDTE